MELYPEHSGVNKTPPHSVSRNTNSVTFQMSPHQIFFFPLQSTAFLQTSLSMTRLNITGGCMSYVHWQKTCFTDTQYTS